MKDEQMVAAAAKLPEWLQTVGYTTFLPVNGLSDGPIASAVYPFNTEKA
jgi:hypothetical protein